MEKVVSTGFGCHYPQEMEEAMNKPKYYVGIDVSSKTFTSSIGCMGSKWQIQVKPRQFENTIDGFAACLHWLQQGDALPENAIICMEATGVYNECLAHFLVANRYQVSIEPPLKVKRAFHPEGHKSDPVDSTQISEYAYRFWDELRIWQPRKEVVEQIKTLLTVREQFVVEKTAHKNALGALKRKEIRTPLAETIHETAITQLKSNIKKIEEEIQRLIDEDPDFRNTIRLLMSIPGVGMMLAAHMLVVIQSAPQTLSAKELASFIGVCPYEHSSGSSVHHSATSRHYGPPGLRRLLFLAAMSVRTHHPKFQQYFYRKLNEGKSPMLVINNIANKLLKIMVAVLRSNTPYITNYQSVNPGMLKMALTRS
jgi:transposase